MSPQELFSLLTVNDIDFNGDIELTDDGILWSFAINEPKEEDELSLEEELIETFEEDLEYINNILEEYEEHMVDVDIEELQIENSVMYADLAIVELDIEEIVE